MKQEYDLKRFVALDKSICQIQIQISNIFEKHLNFN